LSTADREWPTHSEELSRKVIGTLADSIHACHVDHKYDERVLRFIASALYDTVSGLVPWECADIIARAIKELPGQ